MPQATVATNEVVAGEWVAFQGGELEGRRPKAMCVACRDRLARLARDGRAPSDDPRALSHELRGTSPEPRATSPEPRTICFQCYRVELERERALQAAGELDTSSVERFQDGLPFEPVNHARLDHLKAERAEARRIQHAGVGRYVDKRRQAQIAARHALQRLSAGLDARRLPPVQRSRFESASIHAAELQLPEAWLPFVGSR
jgi:hypothetical protein